MIAQKASTVKTKKKSCVNRRQTLALLKTLNKKFLTFDDHRVILSIRKKGKRE
jgi:hypothetical protein